MIKFHFTNVAIRTVCCGDHIVASTSTTVDSYDCVGTFVLIGKYGNRAASINVVIVVICGCGAIVGGMV